MNDILRAADGSVLSEGESLSAFIETTVRNAVSYRQAQAEFHARGQAALEDYRRTGVSYSTNDVLAKLQVKIDARRKS